MDYYVVSPREKYISQTEDSDDQIYGYGYSDGLIYLTIGVVYFLFLQLLVDRFLGYEKIEKSCTSKNIINNPDEYGKLCTKLRDEFELKKYVYMVVLGALSMGGGLYLAKSDKTYLVGGCGLALGGLWAMIWFTLINWSRLNRNFQFLILGLVLISMLARSAHLM
jgi:Na+/proline symporter